MSGWISLHRDIIKWEWYDDINTCRIFIHFLLRANHISTKWRGIDIDRGQFISSISKLSLETNLTVKQVRTSISKLIKTGEVASEGQTQHTVFTVINYDKYQTEGKPLGKRGANEGQTRGKRGATDNNNNNENNENNEKKVTSSFAQPTIEEIHAHMKSKGFDSLKEAENFYYFYDSKGWLVGKVKMKNWKSAASRWISDKKPQGQTFEKPEWMRGF